MQAGISCAVFLKKKMPNGAPGAGGVEEGWRESSSAAVATRAQ